MLRDRSDVRHPTTPPGGLGSSALVLGALGSVFVAVAIALSALSPLTVAGLAFASAGVVLAIGGLVLGTLGAVRACPGRSRTAMSAAGLSVAGLAGGLIWLAAFVILAVTGPGPPPVQGADATPACGPVACHTP
ncbi:hypothetical protein [Pseudonocardia sp. HH130629-09]|uniref:hypothetical protein n=1 Tax=Pseudonocardia sp. HH130629-09 TaxID=1641402 RepID=UPI0006CB5096|nr:hypothetical protein [Pseudonocardia sp. HH130629-09]ALE84965.1 hypothetical protein XF36_18995 [Pseudonocardia sp. HH130629-09]